MMLLGGEFLLSAFCFHNVVVNPIREELNRHKWELHNLDRVTLVVTHRGAPNDEAFVHGTEIAEIEPHGVQLAGEESAFIPYHRIKRIMTPDAEVSR